MTTKEKIIRKSIKSVKAKLEKVIFILEDREKELISLKIEKQELIAQRVKIWFELTNLELELHYIERNKKQ